MAMKILYLINSSKMGGAEKHALDLACGMVQKGHEVWTVLPGGNKFKIQNSKLGAVEKENSLIGDYQKCGIKLIFDSPKLDIDPFFIWRVVRILRREKIQIVHTHQLKITVNGIIAAYLARVPVRIAHIHDTILQWEIPLWKKIPDVIINTLVTNLFATHAIALTSQVKEWLVKGEKINSKKIVIIPNGVEVEKFETRNSKLETNSNVQNSKFKTGKPRSCFLKEKLKLPPETILIGSLGRLTVEKGHIYFIEAIPKILSILQYPPIPSNTLHFVLIGDGKERAKLEQKARELNVQNYITFLGFQPEEDKPKILQSLDIFVFPSIREGFGLAMVEAMAAGLPIVAADLPKALREVASHEEVLFFEPKNSNDLAQKVVKLIENPDFRKSLGERAQKRAQDYSMEKFWQNYDKLYRDALLQIL